MLLVFVFFEKFLFWCDLLNYSAMGVGFLVMLFSLLERWFSEL